MKGSGSFTERVRQELSGTQLDSTEEAPELAVLLRLGARFHRVGTADGSHTMLVMTSTSGATIRRVFRLLPAATRSRPELWVREPGGVRPSTTYGLAIREDVERLATDLGLVDRDGRPVAGLPESTATVALRAMLLTIASLSDPGRPVHLEARPPSAAVGQDLRDAAEELGARVHIDAGRGRLVVKSGTDVTTLLEAAGATEAAAESSEQRRRRHLRNEATRLANADAANVRRTIEAAQHQLDVVERAVARVGWAGLGEELRGLALARLVNPEASLAELGELCDPPVGKSAVHRRMARLAALAEVPPVE